MKILFVVVDGGGNIPPQLAVARALRARGADVCFLGHQGVRNRLQQAGFSFESFTTGADFDPTAQRPLLSMMRDMAKVTTDRRLGRETLGAARRHGIDVVVVDTLLTVAAREVMAANIPTVVFVHCFYRRCKTWPSDRSVGCCVLEELHRSVRNEPAHCRSSLPVLISTPCAAHRRCAMSASYGKASRPHRRRCRCPGCWSA